MQKTRIILADDHPLIRIGERTALSEEPDIIVVGEAKDGYETQHLCLGLQPELLLLDMGMPGPLVKDTVLFIKENCPDTKVIILSAYINEPQVHNLLTMDIRGYILKDEPIDIFVRSIRTIIRGGTWYSSRIIEILSQNQENRCQSLNERENGISPLTFRENEILQQLVKGLQNEEIAETLCISERTVRHYIENIMKKLGVPNRTKAIIVALQNKWITI